LQFQVSKTKAFATGDNNLYHGIISLFYAIAMINLANIYSFTEFQRNAKAFVAQIKGSKDPLVLTVNGKAELIVQDAQAYQDLLDRLDQAETIAGIVKSMEEFEQGKGIPAREALERLRQKHGISG
jgi:PHD/YefM family antitoxin component YafN of YafNO toxin-antitoxin module